MPWISLGRLQLSYQWQLLDTPLVGSTTVRLSNELSGPMARTGLFAQVFPDGEFWGIRKIYPVNNSSIYVLEIPRELEEAGVITRNLAFRLSHNYQTTQTWTVIAEEFTQISPR